MVDELVARIHQESLRRRRREIIRGLEEAERRQDHARAQALAVELKRLRERG